jgi:serine/threonine protein kinase
MERSIDPVIEAAIPTIGTVLGGTYRLLRPLAEGGCGDVFVAAHTRLDREVAVKILHPSLAGAEQTLARFRQEADIMSALRHPHIVQILDFNLTEEGVPFLVMELLDGRPLSHGMASGTPFEPRAAFRIVDQIAQALEAAHGHGIVHLDLKPDNVILLASEGRDDFVKVIDFGISRATWRARLINEPLVTGTPEYMAPEQARGLNEAIDHRADQFSLAALTYTLLTGREPFNGHDPVALLYQVVNEVQQPPSQLAAWLGPGVDAVIAKGMAKATDDRYPSVMAFADALGAAIDGVAVDRRHAPAEAPARDLEPTAESAASPGDSASPNLPGDRDTLRFTRGARRKSRWRRSGSVLLTLASAAAFAWFFPPTRVSMRAAWHRARIEALGAVSGATGSSAAEASSPPPRLHPVNPGAEVR